jgi:hypothetical protein
MLNQDRAVPRHLSFVEPGCHWDRIFRFSCYMRRLISKRGHRGVLTVQVSLLPHCLTTWWKRLVTSDPTPSPEYQVRLASVSQIDKRGLGRNKRLLGSNPPEHLPYHLIPHLPLPAYLILPSLSNFLPTLSFHHPSLLHSSSIKVVISPS